MRAGVFDREATAYNSSTNAQVSLFFCSAAYRLHSTIPDHLKHATLEYPHTDVLSHDMTDLVERPCMGIINENQQVPPDNHEWFDAVVSGLRTSDAVPMNTRFIEALRNRMTMPEWMQGKRRASDVSKLDILAMNILRFVERQSTLAF